MNNLFTNICSDSSLDHFLIFDFSLAPQLLYYAYIPIIVIVLLLGIFVLIKDKFSLLSRALFSISIVFSIFIINEIVLWIAVPAPIIVFSWTLSLLLRLLIILSTVTFTYIFVQKEDLRLSHTLLIFFISLPIFLLLPTEYAEESFNLTSCEATDGQLWSYLYLIESFTVSVLLYWATRKYLTFRKFRRVHDLQSTYLIFAAFAFLLIFFISEFFGTIFDNYSINLIGPLGMLILTLVLSFLIVKYKMFSTKLLAAQVLVVALVILIGSQIFFVNSTTSLILVNATMILACIGGYLLVKSVKKEVALREKVEELVVDLDNANVRLKELDKMKSEFVSIASHQLRSPLTSIRGYASMLEEGSYGKLPVKVQEIISKIADSSKYMALSVEDYLNVSRIEAGNMKYELSDFSLKDVAEKVVDELRPVAIKKGLVMIFRSDCDGSCSVHADIGKTRQVIMNLLDNAMKYTPKGTITVVSHDDEKAKKMYVTIQDTGVGMNPDVLHEVFEKFVRAKNANNVNVTGTGLGLFVAKKMITDMGGRVWAESEGEGRGSTFHIELPLLNEKTTK